jgi:hypothetical protein
MFLWVLARVDSPHFSEQHEVLIFTREDGGGMYLHWHLLVSLHEAKSRRNIMKILSVSIYGSLFYFRVYATLWNP